MWVTAEAQQLDEIGRIIDFSVIKERVGKFIDDYWDHKTLLYKEDPILDPYHDTPMMEHFEVVYFNPTAENMALWLLKHIFPVMFKDTGIKITKVRLYETENCYAEVSNNEEF